MRINMEEEDGALILPLAFYRDPKIVTENTDNLLILFATLQNTSSLFFFGNFAFMLVVSVLFFGGG